MPTKPSVKPNAEIEPFVGESDANKTLLTKLLAVPAARYLTYRRDIAEKCLAWKKLGPVVRQWQKMINRHWKAHTNRLFSTDISLRAVTENNVAPGFGPTAPSQPEVVLRAAK